MQSKLTKSEEAAFKTLEILELDKERFENQRQKIREINKDIDPQFITPFFDGETTLINLLDELLADGGIELASYYIYECRFNPGKKKSGSITICDKTFKIGNIKELKKYYLYAKTKP